MGRETTTSPSRSRALPGRPTWACTWMRQTRKWPLGLPSRLGWSGSGLPPPATSTSSTASSARTCPPAPTLSLSKTVFICVKIDVVPTWGEKWLSLSRSNYEGNQDRFLGVVFVVVGGVCTVVLIIFVIKLVMERNDHSKFQ
jgi:hypothetical protein